MFSLKRTDLKLPPSMSDKAIFLLPARSINVGKISDPETGVEDSDPFLIPGPATISGTLIPPS